jgi:hypothetical protein
VPLEPTAGVYLADLIRERNLSAVLDVSEFNIAERARFLTAFADRLYRIDSQEPMHMILEEAHEYIPQNVQRDEAKMVGVFERLVKMGRWKGLGVTMMSQRSASLNKNVLTQVDNLFVLRTTSPQDRAAVKLWIDVHADARDILATLPSLAPGECWLWQPSRGEPVRFQWRRRSTFDAGATPKIGEKRTVATLADVDLGAITEAMAETIEKAKADDPKLLRARIAQLEKELASRPTEEVVREVEKVVEVPVVSDADVARLEAAAAQLSDALAKLAPAVRVPPQILPAQTRPSPAPKLGQLVAPAAVREKLPDRLDDGTPVVKFRAGAQRMIESLGRMYPLRLTTAQWAMVVGMKKTGGTWGTYLSELKRAGLVVQEPAGWTLTDAGFTYIGGRPAPLTGAELQDHYRGILRAGAVRMLDAAIEAYPDTFTRDQLAEYVEMNASGGTFGTYLSELVRNGLVEKTGDGSYRATDILMKGAAA